MLWTYFRKSVPTSKSFARSYKDCSNRKSVTNIKSCRSIKWQKLSARMSAKREMLKTGVETEKSWQSKIARSAFCILLWKGIGNAVKLFCSNFKQLLSTFREGIRKCELWNILFQFLKSFIFYKTFIRFQFD